MVLAAGEAGALRHFVVRMERLDHAADRVLDEIRLGYPDLVIPYHSRWRHFVVDGVDRWAALAASLDTESLEGGPAEVARLRFDLAVVRVLLDAGAVSLWTYRASASGESAGRPGGVALARLVLFATAHGGSWCSERE